MIIYYYGKTVAYIEFRLKLMVSFRSNVPHQRTDIGHGAHGIKKKSVFLPKGSVALRQTHNLIPVGSQLAWLWSLEDPASFSIAQELHLQHRS